MVTAPKSSSHGYTLGLSYSTQEYQGGNPAALTAVSDGNRNATEMYGYDRFEIRRGIMLDYGARYARYDYIDRAALFSPRLGLTWTPGKGTHISVSAAQRMVAPGAEEFLPPVKPGPWLLPERTFAPLSGEKFRAERARTIDVALEHEFEDAYIFGVRRFHQSVDDQLATLFRMPAADGTESVGHYYVANIGSVDLNGWTLRVASPAVGRLRGSIDYSVARASWLPTARRVDLAALPAAALRDSEDMHDITTSLTTDIPETSTKVFLYYRINTAFTRNSPAFVMPGLDGRFDVQVNQALPFGLAGTQWEVLVGMRNLFRDPNDPASFYDELLVVRPPKRVVGGFLVKF